MIGPVQSPDRLSWGSPVGKRNLRWESFVKKVGFEPGVKWKSEGVMDDESGDDETDELISGWGGDLRQEWWGWRSESGSWFQRRGDAYLNERSVIFKEEMVGRRDSDNRWRAGTARRLKRDKVVKIARLSSCKNFVSKREKFIFDAFVNH